MTKGKVTARAVYEWLGISRETFTKFANAGAFKRQPVGTGYDLKQTVRAIYAHSARMAAGRGGDNAVNTLSSARARQAIAAAETAELRNKKMLGELVPLAPFERMVIDMIAVARERGLSTAGEISDSLTPFTPKDRAAIYEIVDSAIRQMMDALSVHTLNEQKNRAPDTDDDDGDDDEATTEEDAIDE